MGLMKGNLAYTKFSIVPREKKDDITVEQLTSTETFVEMFDTYAWVDSVGGSKRGWVSPLDPSEGRAHRVAPRYWAFSLREDKISINATYKKIRISQAERSWMDAHGASRVPISVRRDLRDAITTDLTERALPAVQLVDVLCSPADRAVYVFSTSANQIEVVREFFCETFDVSLRVEPTAKDEADASGHLVWLWLRSQQSGGQPEVASEDRLTLTRWGTGEKTIVVGEEPSTSEDALRGLLGGKRPTDFRFTLKTNDHEFKLGVALVGDDVVVTRMAVPPVTGTGEEKLDERVSLFLTAEDELAGLFVESCNAREDQEDWKRQVADWIATKTDALS